MATIQDLGKIAYLNKGTYNSETTYEINDVVTYEGSSYVSKTNENRGNLPTNTTYWDIVAQSGDSAYDLYVKNGGTLTEEEWLDAFLNSENYYEKDEIDDKFEEITLRETNEHFVFIGDSYGTPATVDPNWVDKFNELAGLTNGVNSFNFCRGAAGFVGDGTNTYLNNLRNNINSISHKEYVKHVIICGGWNDRGIVYGATDFTPIENLCNYIKEQFPNAKIYCGMIANFKQIDDTAGNIHWRDIVSSYLYKYYKEIENYGGSYLNGVELVMHNYNLFQSDYIHPNTQGYVELGRAIYGAWRQGVYYNNKIVKYQTINSTNYTLADNIADTTNLINNVVWVNNRALIQMNGKIDFTADVTLANNQYVFNLAQYTESQEMLRYVNQYSDLYGYARVVERSDGTSGSQEYIVQCRIIYHRDGNIKVDLIYPENVQGKIIKSISMNFINEKDIINT